MKRKISVTYHWYADGNEYIENFHQLILEVYTMSTILEALRDGYTSGRLTKDCGGVEYKCHWEMTSS